MSDENRQVLLLCFVHEHYLLYWFIDSLYCLMNMFSLRSLRREKIRQFVVKLHRKLLTKTDSKLTQFIYNIFLQHPSKE